MLFRLALAVLVFSLAACSSSDPMVVPVHDRVPAPTTGPTSERGDDLSAEAVREGVRATLDTQVAAWNDGSIRGFMDGYVHSDTLMFLSGGNMRRGWEEAYYAYVRGYPDEAAMGTLSFEGIEIRPLSPDHAIAFGRWRLTRTGDTEEGGPTGLFSLVLQNTDEGWLVVHDHTSSD